MGLFSKKDPCAICGGKVSGLFPWKIDGQYVCNDCHGVIDIPQDREARLTMAEFRDYMTFREQNSQLKEEFVVSQKVDFGLWDTKIVFDFQHMLFCMSKNLDKTIFKGSELKSFTIKEDNIPLYEGSADGLTRYESRIPQKVMAMAPQINQYLMQRQMQEQMERMARQNPNAPQPSRRYFDIPEPFKGFNIELHFEHPYWSVIQCDMDGPTFDNDYPDIDNYLSEYRENIQDLETLVQALMQVAFPGAPEHEQEMANRAATNPTKQTAAASVDAVGEIKKYKALMDDGVITEEEFNAKKKQLMGL